MMDFKDYKVDLIVTADWGEPLSVVAKRITDAGYQVVHRLEMLHILYVNGTKNPEDLKKIMGVSSAERDG